MVQVKVRVRDLAKQFRITVAGSEQTVRALNSVSFDINVVSSSP